MRYSTVTSSPVNGCFADLLRKSISTKVSEVAVKHTKTKNDWNRLSILAQPREQKEAEVPTQPGSGMNFGSEEEKLKQEMKAKYQWRVLDKPVLTEGSTFDR